ncbi:MAG: hypothetical protein COA43_00630 [Robiginitomaculum sp.]|nr:MAG: hypothetical protein COA43_00630 [Robiginitomaculum sp.]
MSKIYQAYLPAQNKFQAEFIKLRETFVKASAGKYVSSSKVAYLCLEAFRNMEPEQINAALAKYDITRAYDEDHDRITANGGVMTVNLRSGPTELARHIQDRMAAEFMVSYHIRDLFIAAIIMAFDLKKKNIKLILEAYSATPVN